MGISFNAASLLNGNGINVPNIVAQLQSISGGQITLWQQEQGSLQTKANLLTSLNNDLNNLATAVRALSDPLGPFTAVSASSSQPVILTASAQSTAPAGNYNVVVSSLASAGTLYTASLADANTSILASGVTTGHIQIQVGGSGGTTADLAIVAGTNDTLSTLATYINEQSKATSWGVTANVVTDASGARLAIYSQSTGSPGALSESSNDTNLTFEPPVGGTNADITVNGIPYSSTTNTVDGAIPGVILNLQSAFPGTTVQVSVGPDTTKITNAINNFVAAYNTVTNEINQQMAIDPNTNAQGPLGSDPSLRSLQSSLLSDVTYATSGNDGLVNLASLGINMNNDGTLSFDAQTFSNAMTADPKALENFFQNADLTGFANNFANDLNNLASTTVGPLSLDLAANSAQQRDIANRISDFQDRLASQKAALLAQFSAVNASLQQYPYLLQEVLSQLGTTSPTSSNTSATSGTKLSG